MLFGRRNRNIIRILAVVVALLLVIALLSRGKTPRPMGSALYEPTFSSYDLPTEMTRSIAVTSIDTHEVTEIAPPQLLPIVTQRLRDLQLRGGGNARHHSTGEFHKIATTESTVSVVGRGDKQSALPAKQKRGVMVTKGESPGDHVIDNAASRANMSVFYEESPDVASLLPDKYLSDYKSFCWYSHQAELFCLPSVYIAGIPKCGTTDVFDKLTWHPKLAVPKYGKEHTYWNRRRLGRVGGFIEYDKQVPKIPFRDYLKNFPIAEQADPHNSMFVDGTPSLLWDLVGWDTRYPGYTEPPYTNADLLHAVVPGAKVIVMVRDPVKRLFSDFSYFDAGRSREEKMMRTPLTFHDDVNEELGRFRGCLANNTLKKCCHSSENSIRLRLHLGVYVCYIEEWKELFQDNLMVVTLEEYSRDPVSTLFTVFSFIGVEQPDRDELHAFITDSAVKNSNVKGKERTGKTALDATVRLLREFYEPYNHQLVTLLNDNKFNFGWESV